MNSTHPDEITAMASAKPHSEDQSFGLKHVLAILFAVGVSVLIFVFRKQVVALERLAYPGIFLIMLITNLTVILPAPGLAIVIALSATREFNPLLVGLASGLGAVLGELTGYLAGYGGSAVIDNLAAYRRLEGWMRRHGGLALLILAFIPNPAFDMAGIAAGVMRFSVWKFLLWAGAGKTARMIVIAYAAYYSADWLLRILTLGSP
jgi:membrane protein DedA with SNARE-associated domain